MAMGGKKWRGQEVYIKHQQKRKRKKRKVGSALLGKTGKDQMI